MEWHPIACIFPMLPDTELQQLADDIRKNGLREPVITFEGKVLDGRNRWQACALAGVKAATKDFKGAAADAVEYVWSTNVHRRHLNSGQVAIAIAKREKLDEQFRAAVDAIKKAAPKGGRPRVEHIPTTITMPTKPSQKIDAVKDNTKRTDHKLAETHGTNRTYVAKSRKVVAEAPELAEKVERGEMTLSQASIELRRQEKRKDLDAKAKQAKKETAVEGQPSWLLIHSDVLKGLQSVADHHSPARLIFADPPYNIGVDYGKHHNDSLPHDEFIRWCCEWMHACVECLAKDGSLWVMINDEYAADFVVSLRDKCGLHMRAWIKWYETFGVNCSNNFNRTSRHILYFVRDPKRFVFNETEVLRPSDRQEKYGDKRAQSSGKIIDDVWIVPRLTGTSKERIPDFPTQLPLELVSRIVAVASEPGDLVVDPFNGSGTTGVAAVQSGRKYVGIDASEKFIDLSEKRLRGVE